MTILAATSLRTLEYSNILSSL